MHCRDLIWLAAASSAAICVLAACGGIPAEAPLYAISVGGAGNRVTYSSSAGETLFEVTSETGLGSADIKQLSGEPPKELVIRLRLRGLEEFDFKYDDLSVLVSVSSHGDGSVSESIRRGDSAETPLGPDSPYWMPVQVVAASDSADQTTGGYFDVRASKECIQGQYQAFSMKWIDFYR